MPTRPKSSENPITHPISHFTKIQNKIINGTQDNIEIEERRTYINTWIHNHVEGEKGVTVLLLVGELMEFRGVREETEVR